MPVTKICKILNEANMTCFTVCFNLKLDEADVRDRLAKTTEAEHKDAKSLAV